MKTLLQLSVILLVFVSCSSLQQNGNNNLGQYDDIYSTSKDDEKEVLTKKSEKKQVDNGNYQTVTPAADEPAYKKYKDGEAEEIVREPNSTSNNSNNNNSTTYNNSSTNNNYNYDDDDDFSYGNSFNRFRNSGSYSNGYNNGYSDALYNNYRQGGGYYNSYYRNPTWGWNRPTRNRFWVGYNTWNGWSGGYNYGYPAWGWRTSYYPCYNNFYDPWYGYSGGWGYYSNIYNGGTPYGYYNPYSYGYGNYGYGNNYGYGGYNNYYSPWYRPVHVYSINNGGNNGSGYIPDKRKMTGPRESIGSNTPSNSRNDQISPRSRGGMVQQDPKGGTTYDPKNDKRGAMGGNDGSNNPTDSRSRMTDKNKEVIAVPDNGSNATARSSDNSSSERVYSNNNGTLNGGNGDNSGRRREIDRTNTMEESSYDSPSRGNDPPSNNGSSTPNSRGRNTETKENTTRSYQQDNTPNATYQKPKEERNTRGRVYQPAESRSRENDQPANNNYQRQSSPSPRSYDGGGSRGGGGYSPSSSGGNSGGGSSSTPSRGRGR